MRLLFAFVLAAASLIPASAQTPVAHRAAPEMDITLPDGSHKLLSSYKGKVVCLSFFFTTCPHCQDMAKLISQQIEPEYKPKGVEFLAAAFNPEAKEQTPEFIKNYTHGVFPMGSVDRGQVLEFLQQSIMAPLYVPVMVFIDRKGLIEDQYVGDPTFLSDPPKNMRAELDRILAKPAGRTVTRISKR